MRIILFALLLSFGSLSCADLTDTIAYIRGLIDDGKKVGLLFIDMQTDFTMERFEFPEAEQVIFDLATLAEHFAGQENVIFVDVNYAGRGSTISHLQRQLKRSKTYRLSIKDGDSAFEVIPPNTEHYDDEKVMDNLVEFLKAKEVTDVIPLGCFDGACVLSTAKEAAEKGFDVAVDRGMNVKVSRTSIDRFESREKYFEYLKGLWDQVFSSHTRIKPVPDVSESYCHL